MLAVILRFSAALLTLLTILATPANSQTHSTSKLDAVLESSVRAGGADTRQVIITATSNGIRGLTTALEARGDRIVRAHPLINALTARVPAAALDDLSHLPFVSSISTDAVVIANQSFSVSSTLRGTLGLP